MKKILASSLHPGSANSLIPVVRELRRERRYDVILLGHLYSEKTFKDANLEFRTIRDYGASELSPECVENIVKTERPDMVLTGTSNQNNTDRIVIEQQMSLAARRLKIKSMSILDYWGRYHDKFGDVFTGEKLKYFPDVVAVMDDIARKEMIDDGFPADRLFVTGSPYFDGLLEKKNKFGEKDRLRVRKDLEVGQDDKLIVFATQPISQYYGDLAGYSKESIARDLIEGLNGSGLKGFKLLVKVHPRDEEDLYQRLLKEGSFPALVNKTYSTTDALLASDLVVSIFSTVLVEVAFFGKPGISLQPGLKESGLSDFMITNKLGATFPVYEYGQIGNVIKDVLEEKIALSGKNYFRFDGKSVKRIMKLIDVLNDN